MTVLSLSTCDLFGFTEDEEMIYKKERLILSSDFRELN